MMKKYILLAAVMFSVMPMMAQETYENAKLIENDLNGTARYVGMGGALEALGADISTISTNPAGIGLMQASVLRWEWLPSRTLSLLAVDTRPM